MSGNSHKTPGKNLGLGMLITSFSLALIALTVYFDGWLANQNNPNRTPESYETESGNREVVLQQNRQGHYVAGGRVNGVPVTFLLDTGATDVAIPERIARAANLRATYSGQAATANGVVTVYATQVDELTIGNITLNNVDASITPSMPGDTILLGMSALKQVEFTQRGETLTLRQLAQL